MTDSAWGAVGRFLLHRGPETAEAAVAALSAADAKERRLVLAAWAFNLPGNDAVIEQLSAAVEAT